MYARKRIAFNSAASSGVRSCFGRLNLATSAHFPNSMCPIPTYESTAILDNLIVYASVDVSDTQICNLKNDTYLKNFEDNDLLSTLYKHFTDEIFSNIYYKKILLLIHDDTIATMHNNMEY